MTTKPYNLDIMLHKKENNHMGYELPPEPKFYPNDSVQQTINWSKNSQNYNEGIIATEVYKHYELNLNKVKSLDDCKKILHFLCRHTLKPIRGDLTYGGFSEVEEYFKTDEI